MVSTHPWARNFTITPDDIDNLMNLLLEQETPLDTETLALAVIRQQLEAEAAALQARYEDTLIYDPAGRYEIGQRLVFPALQYATANVTAVREGDNAEYGDFNVITVDIGGETREFAANLNVPHTLNHTDDNPMTLPGANDFTAEDVLAGDDGEIVEKLETRLGEEKNLLYVGRRWFPSDLVLDVNEGYLNLAEAVLDLTGGGPLRTKDIVEQIGGLGSVPMELQTFSMNFALDNDNRFDEVGAAGEVLWYLTRLEPDEVRKVPALLRYQPVEYDRGLLTDEMVALEAELADELSPLEETDPTDSATVILTYPHRRVGTLPINIYTEHIFPTARRAPRIYVTLVDGQDGEEYTGWVVHRENYVYGLGEFYRKHRLPIGGYVTVARGEAPGKITVDFNAYRPRSEYIRLLEVKNDQLNFENHKRAIGADFDDLMIVGMEDLQAVDALVQTLNQQRKTFAALLKLLIPPLGRLTPQGTVHAKTLYSAVNVLRRCPPGPILATLNANPDFENVGGHYWRLSE